MGRVIVGSDPSAGSATMLRAGEALLPNPSQCADHGPKAMDPLLTQTHLGSESLIVLRGCWLRA